MTNDDLIRRGDALRIVKGAYVKSKDIDDFHALLLTAFENVLPSAQPEVKPISYTDCANAMLMMWIDHVVTDGEYNRIMDKLNAHERKKRKENG